MEYFLYTLGKDVIKAIDHSGNTALHLAAGAGATKAIKWLLDQGVNRFFSGNNKASLVQLTLEPESSISELLLPNIRVPLPLLLPNIRVPLPLLWPSYSDQR